MSGLAPVGAPEEALLRCLYALPVAVWRIDADGSIGLINARAANLLQELGALHADSSGLAVLHALDAGLGARTEAAWLTPGIVAARQRLHRTDARGVRRELAVTVQVLDPRCALVTVEEGWD